MNLKILTLSDINFGRRLTATKAPELLQRAREIAASHEVHGLYLGGNLVDYAHLNRVADRRMVLDAIGSLPIPSKFAVLGISDLRNEFPQDARNKPHRYFETFVDEYRQYGIHLLDSSPFTLGGITFVGGLGGFDGSFFEIVTPCVGVVNAPDPRYEETRLKVEHDFARDYSWLRMSSAELCAQSQAHIADMLGAIDPMVEGIVLCLHHALSWDHQVLHWTDAKESFHYRDGALSHQRFLNHPKIRFAAAGARRHFSSELVSGVRVVDLSCAANQPYLLEIDPLGRLVDVKTYEDLIPSKLTPRVKLTSPREGICIDSFNFKYHFTVLFQKLMKLSKSHPEQADPAQIESLRGFVEELLKIDISTQDQNRITDHIFSLYSYNGPWRNVTAWIKAIGLDVMLKQIGSLEDSYTPAWFLSKEALPFFEVGRGDGETAGALQLSMLLHVTNTKYAFDQLTVNRLDQHPNIGLMSREGLSHWGEHAEYGSGFYCTRADHGAAISGAHSVLLLMDPKARRGSDFQIAFDDDDMKPYIRILNNAAITLPNSPLAGSIEHRLALVGLWTKYGKRTATNHRFPL